MAKTKPRMLPLTTYNLPAEEHAERVQQLLEQIEEEGGRMVSVTHESLSSNYTKQRSTMIFYEIPVPERLPASTDVEPLSETLLGQR